MGKLYKIDRSHFRGTALFVVEGGNAENGGTELRLLKKIFTDILGYEMQELRRGTNEFRAHYGDTNATVIGMNLPKNQINGISEKDMDRLYQIIRDELKLKPEDYPLFYIYDRDFKSYKFNQLQRFIKQYTDPYSSEKGDQGQLLLSYPAVEAYVMSCFKENTYEEKYLLGKDMKAFANKDSEYSIEKIKDETHLLHAVTEMDLAFSSFGCGDYDIDNLAGTLLGIYQKQQDFYKVNNAFSVLSQISLALLQLGIIAEENKD